MLVRYDPERELVVSCDASPYDIGRVLTHLEKPVVHASRTLLPVERGYGHFDKEARALDFAMKKFHQFLYRHHVIIYSRLIKFEANHNDTNEDLAVAYTLTI